VQYEEPIVDNEKSNKPNDEVCQIKNIFQSILSFKIDFKNIYFAALLQGNGAYYKHN
jgi:hypothetical protein